MSAALKRPLDVVFTGAMSSRIEAIAGARGVKPSVLVGAVMRVLTDDDSLLDALLDGDHLADLAPGFAFLLNGLTRRQGAVLFVLAKNDDRYGVTRLSDSAIARRAGIIHSTAHSALHALAERGLIARADAPEGRRWPWCLTEAGWRVARTLGGVRRKARGLAAEAAE